MVLNNLDDEKLKIVQKELLENLKNYRKTLSYMIGDAPIEVLGLNKTLETVLINSGCTRIYDVFDRDLSKIKGIGDVRIRELTARIDEFLSMCG
jgi:hypothetical protein